LLPLFFVVFVICYELRRKITHFIAHIEIYQRLFLLLSEKSSNFAA